MIQIENYFLLFLFALLAISITYYFLRNQVLNIRWVKLVIGSLRFLSLFTLLVLLLSPILKCTKTKSIKPKVVVLLDNSRSIRSATPMLQKRELNKIIENIENTNLDIVVKVFDKEVKPLDSLNQSGSRTDIYSAINTIISKNVDDHLTRIILLTDGNYNEGNNPIFINNKGMIPIDVVLMGDTAKVSDYKIENLEFNNLMLQDETNPLNVIVSAYGTKSIEANVVLEEVTSTGAKVIDQSKIRSNSNFFSQSIQFKLFNISKGKHNYRVSIKSNLEERNLRNNNREFSLEVIDGTKQVEILSSFPHPDLTAFKSWLTANKSFKVNLNISESNLSFSEKSDLIVFYQLPNQYNNGRALFEKARSTGKSVLFVLGSKSDYTMFNQLQQCYKVNLSGNISQDYSARLNSSFSKFYLKDPSQGVFQTYPPLSNNLVTIESKLEASHLLLSRLGRIDSEQPLISFSNQDNMQIGLIAAENLWKWRVTNYQTKKNFQETQDLMDKIINYLAIKKDKKQLVINMSNDNIPEGDNFTITANTYNELYQPKRATKIKCIIQGGGQVNKTYDMLPLESSYSLSPKDLKAGRYKFEILAELGGKVIKDQGDFTIYKDDLEDIYSPANYDDMHTLALKSGGHFFMWKDRMNLRQIYKPESDIKVKLVEETIRLKANDLLYLLLLILVLLSTEWLLRKYFGLN